jgi:Mrp family chromosome partitioning ATPase
VKDPILNTDLKTLGWIQRRIKVTDKDNSLELQLKLPTLLHAQRQELTSAVESALREELTAIAGEKGIDQKSVNVNVEITAAPTVPVVARRPEEHDEVIRNLGPGLAKVAHFLAVYSCKGGVGKSTIAVNLAYELARLGGRVGLLDVDIYGPSLPTLVHPSDPTVRRSPIGKGMVEPIEYKGVKLLSLGFVSPDSGVPGSGPEGGAAVMRGPMAGRVVTQLLKGTDWGELDVLILDLPPGTGDVQLAVCQDLELSGAVAVTTPSKLAATDARKGIQMFTSLGVPTLVAVENMSYFVCEGGVKHYPFGRGTAFSSDNSNVDFKSSNVFHLPISTLTNDSNDSGEPLCVLRPEAARDELDVFNELATALSKELLLIQHGKSRSDSGGVDDPASVVFGNSSEAFDVASTHLSLDKSKEGFLVRLFSNDGATQLSLSADELRSRHPKTGEKLDLGDRAPSDSMVQHHKAKVPRLMPAKIEKKGRYGYAVEYADGATIIYSMLSIAKAAGGSIARKNNY